MVNGLPTVSPLPPPPGVIFKDVPSNIALPFVMRSDLQCYHINAGMFYMDIVTISNSNNANSNIMYAYKHHGLFLPQGASDDGPLAKLKLLERVHSPHVLHPAFVVADSSESASKPLRFCGYLVPFLPAGSLLCIMQELSEPPMRPDAPVSADHKKLMLQPKQAEDSKSASVLSAICLPPPKLAWPLKFTWAIEATAGICALHEQGIYTGDVKLSNILLDQGGHLQIIDFNAFLAGGYTAEFLGHEVEDKCFSPLNSGAQDIFALRMVLWMVAEEIWYFGREVKFVRPELVWRDHNCDEAHQGKGEMLRWFTDLVEKCLDEESKRPSAEGVL
ncbi:hypothetical protein C0993_000945 [Termitomyces sp. T159_Od127]|nr:hypothetical protein C0993_000945 [Termitomyces sp. T159_Od127]